MTAKGYLSQPQKSFRLTPASQESGYHDTSINHDTVLAEFTLSHNHPLAKFSGILSDSEAKELQQAIKTECRQVDVNEW